MDILYYRPLKLNNNMLLIEGDKDNLAMFDIEAKDFVAYYVENKKKDYFNFFQACFAKSKNLLFLLHNNQEGAIISSYAIDSPNKKLIYKDDYKLHEKLKAEKLNPYINQYFVMQFNPQTNRLNMIDDDVQVLFTLKLDTNSTIVTDPDHAPLKLVNFPVKDSSCWGHFLMLEGEKYFMHYFPYESFMQLHKLKAQ